MKVKIGKYGESQEYKFGDGKLFIRPYPASMTNIQGDGTFVKISGEDQLKAFMYCLTGWENFTDEETGEDIKLTDEVKRYIYNYPELKDDDGTIISVFVLRKGKVAAEELEEDEKNS